MRVNESIIFVGEDIVSYLEGNMAHEDLIEKYPVINEQDAIDILEEYKSKYQDNLHLSYTEEEELILEKICEDCYDEYYKILKKMNIKENAANNLVDYFACTLNIDNLIERLDVQVSEEQERKISNILGEYNREWNDAPCDDEGATAEQDANLDRIIDECATEIAKLF